MSSDEGVEDLLSAFDELPAGLRKRTADEAATEQGDAKASSGEAEARRPAAEPGQPVPAQTASQTAAAPTALPQPEAGPVVGETAPNQPKPEAGPEQTGATTSSGEAESPQPAPEPVAAPTQPKPEAGPIAGENAPSQPVTAQTANQPAAAPSQPVAAPMQPPFGQPSQSAAAPPPQAPYLDPSAFFTQLQAETKRPRRTLRLILRWTAALLVAGAVGSATAYVVTLPRRTDLPFLTTPNDGRYEFPGLVKPASSPAPDNADANPAQIHYGDLRQYLLPAPRGARITEDGWLPTKDFEAEFLDADLPGMLNDNGLRRVAQRAWTTPDGQHTVIRLVQFPDHQTAFSVGPLLSRAEFRAFSQSEDTPPTLSVPAFGDDKLTVPIRRYDAVDKLPNTIARSAVFQIGDIEVVVTSTAPKRVPDVATEQVVLLQAEMLR